MASKGLSPTLSFSLETAEAMRLDRLGKGGQEQ